MSLNLVSLLRDSARQAPDHIAIIFGEKTFTYAELFGIVQRIAGALRNVGVRPGEHVAILMPNVPQFTIAYFAAQMIGAAVVPLNVLLTADEIEYHLADSDAVTLVAWDAFLGQAKQAFERALELSPHHFRSMIGLAYAVGSIDFSAEVERLYRKSIDIAPTFLEAHTRLGDYYADLEETEQAIREYQAAIIQENVLGKGTASTRL